MGKKILFPAVLAAMLAASVPAMAQERGYQQNDRGSSYQDSRQQNQDRYQSQDRRYQGQARQREDQPYQGDGGRGDAWRGQGDRYDRDRGNADRYGRDNRNARGNWGRTASEGSGYDGYGPEHNLHRGERLPSRFRSHQYVVDNWRSHHLSRPPHGQQWVQVGADYVLVAAATGLIVSALSGQ
jgi:Ni/Co efflux regulator RcnB